MKISVIFLLSFSLLFICCNPAKKMMKEPNTGMSTTRPFDKEGHRGCRGLMPENTIPAMIKALELGVTTLEMDISFTKDKQAILSHEPFFNHEITTRPDGTYIDEKDERSYNIYQMTYDSVKKYDVGLKPHPRFPQQQKIKAVKPLLADVFEAIVDAMKTRRRPYPQFNIETKCMPDGDDIYHPKPAEFVELLMKVIQQYHMEENVIIQSFDVRSLQYLHQHYPTIRTALLIEGTDKSGVNSQLNKLGFTPTIYSPDYSLVNQLLVNKCHEKNMLLIPWTVDDKKNIDNLMQLGVDGIITDYPNLFN